MANNVTFIIQLKDQFSRMSRKFNQSVDGMNTRAGAFNSTLRDFKKRGAELRDLSGGFAKAGAIMSAAITLPAAMMGRSMINAASDAEETANKFAEVFKGIEAQSGAAVAELTGGFSLAQSSAQELLSDTGDLLVGLGLNREQALKMSADVVKLSADVASFKNVQGGTARASSALTKALLGEREMLKETFKTAVREEEVKARAAIIRMKDRKLTEQQAKALATLAIVTERNKDAIGDLARTADSYANVARANDEATKTLSESFGKLLLPVATKVIKGLTAVTKWIGTLSPGMKKFILVLAGLAAVAGPLLLVIAGLITAFSVLSLPILGIAAAVLGLVAVGALLVANWDSISEQLAGAWEGMQMAASDAASYIGDSFNSAWASIKAGVAPMANWVINRLNGLLAPINLIREGLGFEKLAIPAIEVAAAAAVTGATAPAPSAPSAPVGGSLSGQIVVSAAPGARVDSTSMQAAGPGLNIGMNMAR